MCPPADTGVPAETRAEDGERGPVSGAGGPGAGWRLIRVAGSRRSPSFLAAAPRTSRRALRTGPPTPAYKRHFGASEAGARPERHRRCRRRRRPNSFPDGARSAGLFPGSVRFGQERERTWRPPAQVRGALQRLRVTVTGRWTRCLRTKLSPKGPAAELHRAAAAPENRGCDCGGGECRPEGCVRKREDPREPLAMRGTAGSGCSPSGSQVCERLSLPRHGSPWERRCLSPGSAAGP